MHLLIFVLKFLQNSPQDFYFTLKIFQCVVVQLITFVLRILPMTNCRNKRPLYKLKHFCIKQSFNFNQKEKSPYLQLLEYYSLHVERLNLSSSTIYLSFQYNLDGYLPFSSGEIQSWNEVDHADQCKYVHGKHDVRVGASMHALSSFFVSFFGLSHCPKKLIQYVHLCCANFLLTCCHCYSSVEIKY